MQTYLHLPNQTCVSILTRTFRTSSRMEPNGAEWSRMEPNAAFLRGLPEKLWSKKVYRPGPARAQGVCVPQRDLGVLIRQFNDIVFLQTHPRHTIHKCTQLPCPLLSVPLSRASHGSRTQRYCRGPERSLCVSACIRAHAHAMQSQQ